LLIALVVLELFVLALLGGLLSSLGAIGKPSSRGFLLTHLIVCRLTSVSKSGVSARHIESWSLLLPLSRSRVGFGSFSGIDVPLVVFNILHFYVVAVSLSSVIQHDGRGSTSGLDFVGANITLIHGVDGELLSDIHIVGEVDLRGLATLVLRLRAESQGEICISIRSRASIASVVHLVTVLISTAIGKDLLFGVELLSIVSLEAEIPTSLDALSAFEIGGVLC